MHKSLKSLLFVIALSILDNNLLCIKSGFLFSYASAQEYQTQTIDVKESQPEKGGATFAQCGSDVVLGLFGLTAGLIAGLAALSIIPAIGVGILVGVIAGAMQLAGCLWSFVRNPVIRDDDGNYKYCENLQYIDPTDQSKGKFCQGGKYTSCGQKSTDDITKENQAGCVHSWPRNKASNGEYIEICYRQPLGGLCLKDIEECKKGLDPRELAFKTINLGVFGDNQSLEDVINMKARVGKGLTCKTIKAGETTSIGPYKYIAEYEGGQLCAYMKFTKRSKLGCQLRAPVPPSPMCANSIPIFENGKIKLYDNSKCFNCYISPACYGETGRLSHAVFPMTSLVVQCVQDSLKNVLLGRCNNQISKEGFLIVAQKRLKNAVQAIILLAIIFFGFKLMVGGVQGLHEWGMFIIKIALILYFTVGDGMHFYYDQLIKLSTGLADIVQKAGDNQSICDFNTNDYIYYTVKSDQALTIEETRCHQAIIASTITDSASLQQFISTNSSCSGVTDDGALFGKLEISNRSDLAIWDRLDCRIAFYMGQSLTSLAVVAGMGAVASFPLLAAILGLMFAGQIVIAIVLLLYIILLLMVIIWITHLFILAIISLTIIVLFSPIFIPMCLFQVTKSFFDGWLKELMSYSIYPLVLFGFLSLMLSVLDKLYFDDLKFKKVEVNNWLSNQVNAQRVVYNFELEDPSQCKQLNAEGELRSNTVLACIMQNLGFGEKTLLFGITVGTAGFDGVSTTTAWQKIGMMALMLFLFYHFTAILGGLAAELVGNFRADLSKHTGGPQQMAAKAVAAGIKVGKAIATGGGSLADDAKSATAKKAREVGSAKGGSDDPKNMTEAVKQEAGGAAGAAGGAGGATGGGGGSGGG